MAHLADTHGVPAPGRLSEAGRPSPDEVEPAHAVLRRHLGTQAASVLRQAPLLHHGDGDAARRMGGAVTRIADTLRTFAPLVDEDYRVQLHAELEWLTATLSSEQDLRSLGEHLRLGVARLDRLGGAVENQGIARARLLLERRFTRELTTAHGATLAALASARFHALADRLAVLADEMPAAGSGLQPCGSVLPPLLLGEFHELASAVDEVTAEEPPDESEDAKPRAGGSDAAAPAGSSPHLVPSDDEVGQLPLSTVPSRTRARAAAVSSPSAAAPPPEDGVGGRPGRLRPVLALATWDSSWSGLMTVAQRCRAAAELCAPVFGDSISSLAASAEEYSRVLSEQRLAARASNLVAELAASPRIAQSTAFCLGVLYARELAVIEETRARFRELWADAEEPFVESWAG